MDNEYRISREARIKARAEMYIAGEMTLDQFYEFEKEYAISEELEMHRQLIEQEMETLHEAEKYKSETELDHMTAEAFKGLSLPDQEHYYSTAPDKVREILERRPSYMDIIDPKPPVKSFKGTTVDSFKKMKLSDLNELYETDPELYEKLQAEVSNK